MSSFTTYSAMWYAAVFSLPIRQGFAQETYVVTSGEFEALYQVTNVSKAIKCFEARAG